MSAQQINSHLCPALAFACATLALACPIGIAQAEPAAQEVQAAPRAGEPEPPASGTGWAELDGERYWFDNGVMARDKEVFDPDSRAWYWFDADGTMARDKDVFVPVSNEDRTRGKWARYDASGHMVKGLDYRYGSWYYFDETTGEMAKGFVYLPDGQKWVYFDAVTGRMLYGEQAIDGQWYYLDEETGAVTYGWHRFEQANKTVFYSWPSGVMVHGSYTVNGIGYHFDELTGALDAGQQMPEPKLVSGMVSPISLGDAVASGEVRSVRIFGDSIMAGVGALGYEHPDGEKLFTYGGSIYREPSSATKSASNLLRAYLGERGVSLVNASVAGFGSMCTYDKIGDDILGDEDLAIVVLGTNDRGIVDAQETLEDFTAYAESFLTRVSEHYDGKMIVLSPIPVVSEDYRFTLREVSDALRELCEAHGWAYASLHDAFMATLAVQGLPAELFYTDGTHPNHLGQELLWDTLCRVLDIDGSGIDWDDVGAGDTGDSGAGEGQPGAGDAPGADTGSDDAPDADGNDADAAAEDTPGPDANAGEKTPDVDAA